VKTEREREGREREIVEWGGRERKMCAVTEQSPSADRNKSHSLY